METTESRWFRWDMLINEKKYIQVIKEFDLLIANKNNSLTFGDLVRRDEALDSIGVISFTKERAKKTEVVESESRRGKY
jgi:hypothetical protein